ncbi:MAG TPA: DUF222 domain-containing protein [Aeromicrobium sp.]|nr:DUF222 domain-containing protein [Aeromicrobium sp.]
MGDVAEVEVAEAGLAEAARQRAQAEAVEWARILAFHEMREAAIEQVENPRVFQKQAELSLIALEIGRQTGLSEMQVRYRVAAARRVRDKAPSVWTAFADGRIDAARVREISGAIEKLKRPESIARLDLRVVDYAAAHTIAELRRWLKLFVARSEADLFNERAEDERRQRRVEIVHGDDGMSWLSIYDQSHRIAAIDKRLTKQAKALGADDDRSLQQRRTDLAAAWLTTNESGQAALNADIAVTIPGEAIAGSAEAPAVAADGSWVVPIQWMLDLAEHAGNNVFWHRMILDPVTDDVLAHEYKGRFAPAVLAKAIEFRDGVCQAPGCCRPASQCDIDHRIPHEIGGPTAAWNLGPYCRRHHIQKGFGLIDTGPTSKSPPQAIAIDVAFDHAA